MQYIPLFFLLAIILQGCGTSTAPTPQNALQSDVALVVLGIAQDAGFPQADCQKDCCQLVWKDKSARKMVSCLGLVEASTGKIWLFDATPDFKDQLYALQQLLPQPPLLSGIFLTHAHIGHYTGLMHLGREAMGAHEVPVYAMPRMKSFLENNGPWSQLVALKNIQIMPLSADSTIQLSDQIRVTPIRVPHRDEFSETVGYKIEGKSHIALYIPDIDKWHLWERDIIEEIKHVDYAFLDGSFYQNGEIKGRDMSQIPHPFLEESMRLFKDLPESEKNKIHFIHFNHTNPVLQPQSQARRQIHRAGFQIADEGLIFPM